MDLSYSEDYEIFRKEVQAFLAKSWPPHSDGATGPSAGTRAEQSDQFRGVAIEAGYLARSVPKKYGGGEQPADVLRAAIIREEFRKVRAPLDVVGLGVGLLVPTLLERGEEWQREKFIEPTIRGWVRWCQGYSEPGSGSDLASLQTKAEIVGDEWVINGQKIWTSGAHLADYCFCLCRTEPDQPKHAGISYLLIPMKQAGVDVRPLKQMTGAKGFNEVFFTDAKTPADWIVGKRGEGWFVSRTTLKHERNGLLNVEAAAAALPRLLDLARTKTRNGRPAIEDTEIRQRLAAIEGYMRANQYSLFRRVSKAAKGESAGPIDLMAKICRSEINHMVSKLAYDLLEEEGLYAPSPSAEWREGATDAAGWVSSFMGSLGGAIAAGSTNIQRNVIAERGYGLPRDWAAQRSK